MSPMLRQAEAVFGLSRIAASKSAMASSGLTKNLTTIKIKLLP